MNIFKGLQFYLSNYTDSPGIKVLDLSKVTDQANGVSIKMARIFFVLVVCLCNFYLKIKLHTKGQVINRDASGIGDISKPHVLWPEAGNSSQVLTW